MILSHFRFPAALRQRCLAVALLALAVMSGAAAQGQIINFYVAETAETGLATTLLDYTFNESTGLAALANSYAPSGITGVSTSATTLATDGALQVSGDGSTLSYAGFTGTTSTAVLFNLSTQTFDTSTKITSTTSGSSDSTSPGARSAYTQDGNTIYIGGVSNHGTPAYVSKGGSTGTSLTSTAYSVNYLTYNSDSQTLFFSKASATGAGIFMASGQGLPTSSTTFTQLSGTGWSGTAYYDGIGFFGSSTLFTTCSTGINVFIATDPTSAAGWNLNTNLSLSFSAAEMVQQLSVYQIDANDALIFFTTNGAADATLLAGGTSTVDEVSWNSTTGFGTVNVLASSTTEYFTGVAAVPEPDTYALLGLGAGLLGLVTFFKKSARSRA